MALRATCQWSKHLCNLKYQSTTATTICRNSVKNHTIRQFSGQKTKNPAERRRQYFTAACCVAGGAFIAGITFTTIPLGRLLCRVSKKIPMLNFTE